MRLHRWLLVAMLAALVLAPERASAQRGTMMTVEALVGLGGGMGPSSEFLDHDVDLYGEATLAFRTPSNSPTARMWALSLAGQSPFIRADYVDATTPMTCGVAPGTSWCRQEFPSFVHLGVLAGVERHEAGTFRALVGPAYYWISGGRPGLGAQLQLDAAAGFSHVQMMVAARGSQVFRFDGRRFGLFAFGLGLRGR